MITKPQTVKDYLTPKKGSGGFISLSYFTFVWTSSPQTYQVIKNNSVKGMIFNKFMMAIFVTGSYCKFNVIKLEQEQFIIFITQMLSVCQRQIK